MKKQLTNRLICAFTISMIVSITTCGIAFLWDRNSVNVSFVKDVFSIVMSIIAPYIAILLFTDWREQTNKLMLASESKDLWKEFVKLEKTLNNLINSYQVGANYDYIKIHELELYKTIIPQFENIRSLYKDLNYFFELSNNKDNKLMASFLNALHKYEDELEEIKDKYANSENRNLEASLRRNLINEIKNIRKYLLKYIIV